MELFQESNLKKTYFSATLPVVTGLVVTLIYNLVDTYFITATHNEQLVAGVSLCSPLFTALMAFGNIYGQGGSSLISRLLGAKDEAKVRQVSSFCFYISIITGVFLTVLLLVFRTPLLALLGAREETLKHASDYYTVLSLGAPIIVLNFIHANLLRCEGMALQSMSGSMIGSVVNLILDPILILHFGMGTLGAAIATIIGYFCSVFYFFRTVQNRSSNLSVSIHDFRVSASELSQIMGVGISAALANLMSSISIALLNNALLPYGSRTIASMGIVLKIVLIPQLVLTGFAFGAVPLFGYLYGSQNRERIRELTRFVVLFMSALSIAFTAILGSCRVSLLKIFSQDSNIIATGANMLFWQVLGTVFASHTLYFTVMFQATGKTGPALIMSVSRQGIVFCTCIYLLRLLFGYSGIIASQFVSDIISSILGITLYLLVFKRQDTGKEQVP